MKMISKAPNAAEVNEEKVDKSVMTLKVDVKRAIHPRDIFGPLLYLRLRA